MRKEWRFYMNRTKQKRDTGRRVKKRGNMFEEEGSRKASWEREKKVSGKEKKVLGTDKTG